MRATSRAFLLIASFAAAAGSLLPAPGPRPPVSAVVAAQPPAPHTPAPTPVPMFKPSRIELPSLGVDAPIVPVGIEADGSMGTPKTARDVAWWDGVMVGEGNALLAGHKDWNKRAGSFFRLGDLRPGDAVKLVGDGAELGFVVEWVKQVPGDAAAAEFFGEAGRPVLTLVTCGGTFNRRVRHYMERIVVRAVLV